VRSLAKSVAILLSFAGLIAIPVGNTSAETSANRSVEADTRTSPSSWDWSHEPASAYDSSGYLTAEAHTDGGVVLVGHYTGLMPMLDDTGSTRKYFVEYRNTAGVTEWRTAIDSYDLGWDYGSNPPVAGVVIDGTGAIYVAHGTHSVSRFDRNGLLTATTSSARHISNSTTSTSEVWIAPSDSGIFLLPSLYNSYSQYYCQVRK